MLFVILNLLDNKMTLYESTERYLKGPDGMRNEVDMWYSGACLLFQEIIRKKQGKSFLVLT